MTEEEQYREEMRVKAAEAAKIIADNENEIPLPVAICVWRFYFAPPAFQALSHHGGDEDWLALLPPVLWAEDPPWAWTGSEFGCCEVQRVDLPNGWKILIGAHA